MRLRCIFLALVASVSMPATSLAQVPVAANPSAYAFCTVTDTSRVQAKVWASAVVAVEHAVTDPGGVGRSVELAGEFLAWVQAQGGQGAKSCNLSTDPQALAALREQSRAIWDQRVYFVKIGEWHEAAWTPKPWVPAVVAAEVTRYFHCHATQTDLPDRSARARTVATGVFARPVPGDRAIEAMYAQAEAYTRAFQPVVQAHGLPVQGSCVPYDSLVEAQYAQGQLLRLFNGFNMKYTEVAWTPEATAAASAAPPAPAAPSPVPAQASPAAAIVPAPVVGAPATQDAGLAAAAAGYHCFVVVTRTEPPLVVRTPVHRMADSRPADSVLLASLRQATQAVKTAYPGKWHDKLERATCYDNAAVFPGETFCVASTYKISSGAQMAGMYCNASQETLEKRVQDHRSGAGPAVQTLEWP